MSDGMGKMMMRSLMVAVLAVSGCGKLEQVGRAPEFTGLEGTDALKGWSGITTSVWLGSIPLLFLANALVG